MDALLMVRQRRCRSVRLEFDVTRITICTPSIIGFSAMIPHLAFVAHFGTTATTLDNQL